jgi:hypothetical protein
MGNYYFGGMHMNAIKACALLVTRSGKFITRSVAQAYLASRFGNAPLRNACQQSSQIARKENMLRAISLLHLSQQKSLVQNMSI